MQEAHSPAGQPGEPNPRYSIVVPVYGNEGTIPALVEALDGVAGRLEAPMEVVFVDDCGPDRSIEVLRDQIAGQDPGYSARVIRHSRNFGSFAAIRTGLGRIRGEYAAVMAADLQEPPELALGFFAQLEDGADVVVGTRTGRSDPGLTALASNVYWKLYRRFVWREMPPGGIDVFGCNRRFADRLLELEESNSSLVTLLMWLGFDRREVPYERLPRAVGESGWSFRKKLRYLSDSVYSFTDLPIRLLLFVGAVGTIVSLLVAATVVTARLAGAIDVPGYTATIIAISVIGALILFALGIIGAYVWRTYENTKGRPVAIVMDEIELEPKGSGAGTRPASSPEEVGR